MKFFLMTCSVCSSFSLAVASESLTDEPDGDSYNFVSHYSVEIDAPATSAQTTL